MQMTAKWAALFLCLVLAPSARTQDANEGLRPVAAALSDAQPMVGRDTLAATLAAAKRYAAIAEAGGWAKLAKPLKTGATGKAVAALRRRLAVEGDLAEGDAQGDHWDDRLTDAVKRFQLRTGLTQTGAVSPATVRELNIPAARRARALSQSARRLSTLRFSFPWRYVAVNIPAAAVEAIENGEAARRHAAIVGGAEHRSPELVAKIVSVDLNPAWTVPVSIVKNEVVPKLRRDPSYLSRLHMRVFDSRGRGIDPRRIHWSKSRAASYMFRQDPGAENSLGLIRINMPNKHLVFMHDTPKKKLFAQAYRFLSHGCVRIENIDHLAVWLLEGASESSASHWDTAALAQRISEGTRTTIRLPHPLPTIWAYMTGWASADGTTHFRRDIYGKDKTRAKMKMTTDRLANTKRRPA